MTDHDDVRDVIIVGAGMAGIATLRRLRQDGRDVQVYEAGSGIGGTWFWNRYPGARVDIESAEYSFPFPEIEGRWRWPEKYSGQEDVRLYLEWVVDELGIRDGIQLNTTVEAAAYDEATDTWSVTLRTADGSTSVARSRYLILATGFLSVPKVPDIAGLDDFAGELAFTARWPEGGIDVAGKRVGVIGTAASGIQVIQSTAPVADELVVFQRTANWAFPLRNVPMTDEYHAWVADNYPAIREAEYANRGSGTILVGGVITPPNPNAGRDATREEIFADLDFRWNAGGPHVAKSFVDVITDEQVNDIVREWWIEKIREAVTDPEIAEKLIPDHRPMTRRPPGSSGYYEVYNRPNVQLVDIKADPIDRVLPGGVRLSSGAEHDLDVLVLATGFDAGGGAAMQMDLRGRDGRRIQDHWEHGVRSHLGLVVEGYPNLLLIDGPQSPSVHFSPPLLSTYQADVVARLLASHEDGRAIEGTTELEDRWNEAVDAEYAATLIPQTDSWWMGANIPGKPRRPVAFSGGFTKYKKFVEEWLATNP